VHTVSVSALVNHCYGAHESAMLQMRLR